LGSGKRAPISIHSSDSLQRTAQQTEVTEEDIERELGESGVYYRFSPQHTIEGDTFGVESNQFGSIKTYTRVYLDSVKTVRAMEGYLKASMCTGTISLTFRGDGETFSPSMALLALTMAILML
jgi:hypothetical protein